MDKTKPVPVVALCFDASAPVALAAASADAPRTFSGIAYSGEVVGNHFYWGNVVFDLSTTRAPDNVPILIDHDRAQRAGMGQLSIGKDIRIVGKLLNNPHGNAVAADADAGFPWQLSVHIEPGRVEEVAPGKEVVVNGHTLTGPLSIFRDALIRETSFTPTGADSRTSARVFAGADVLDIPVVSASTPQEVPNMSNTDDTAARITALEADLAKAQASATAADARAEAAENGLAGMKASVRTDQIKTLFAAIGREFSDESAKPYLDLPEETFSALAADMRAAVPEPSPHLFAEQAIKGAQKDAAALDFHSIYAARAAKKVN